jgi:hypothetical protein
MPARTSSLRRRVTAFRKNLLKNRKKVLAVFGGIAGSAVAIFAIALIATAPPPANKVVVSFRVVEPYGGVFETVDACDVRPGYSWLNQTVIVNANALVSPAPVITVEALNASRTSADACEYNYVLTIDSPKVGPIDQILGRSKVPEELGLYTFEVGGEIIGTEKLFRTAEIGVKLVKSISVTNKVLGLYEIGDKWTSCTGNSGTYPSKWNCSKNKGVSTGLFWWDISIYSTVQINANQKTGVCSGLRSLIDFKSGASVTVIGDNGSVRGKLVASKDLGLDLIMAGVNATRASGYYLYSKSSRVVVCPLAFEIPDVPYSRGGYTIKVAGRPEFFVSAEDIEKSNWFVQGKSGDTIPGN